MDLEGRASNGADYTYRLVCSEYPGWCKHLLAVWLYEHLARHQAPAPAAPATLDTGKLMEAVEDACAWLETLQERVREVMMYQARPRSVGSINDFYRLLSQAPELPPAA